MEQIDDVAQFLSLLKVASLLADSIHSIALFHIF